MSLEVEIRTLFPAMVAGPLGESIPRRIQDEGIAEIRVRDLRDWGLGRHRTVDVLEVSCRDGDGLERLKKELLKRVGKFRAKEKASPAPAASA